jgi:cytochrome c oxidase assembly protein subunit 15
VSGAARFAWATLCFNVAVVLWGAFVRATGSGAGCGNKWPDCGGTVLGTSAKTQTIIEFTHRITSGVALLTVVVLLLWCWRVTAKGNWARYSAVLATAFLANEALLGAALVLLGHVARDQSAGRILLLCLHFGNTLLLLAALALTAGWLQSGRGTFTLIQKRTEVSAVVVGLLAVLAIGMTGTVAALADTLFPATSLRASVLQDFASGSPGLLHFRLFHPVLAAIAGIYVIWVVLKRASQSMGPSRTSVAAIILLLTQIGIGMLNVLLLAPVWLQILHLLVADSMWISLVLASAAVVLEDPFARLDHADHELEAIAPAQHGGISLQNLLSRKKGEVILSTAANRLRIGEHLAHISHQTARKTQKNYGF